VRGVLYVLEQRPNKGNFVRKDRRWERVRVYDTLLDARKAFRRHDSLVLQHWDLRISVYDRRVFK
jgi:hypothetical protein